MAYPQGNKRITDPEITLLQARIPTTLHINAKIAAAKRQMTLTDFVEEALVQKISSDREEKD